jgi:DNA primase
MTPHYLASIFATRGATHTALRKSADRLAALGLVATCSPMGAGKWRDEYSDNFRGRDVVIFPDNDKTGRDHAADVARSLNGIARRVRIIELPGLADKEDVHDFLSTHGHSINDLLDMVDNPPAPARRFKFLSASELKSRPDPEWIVEGAAA